MQYVEATEGQVLNGSDPTVWAQQVADYINNVIRGGRDFTLKTTQGDYLTITRDTAYKAGTRNQVKNPDGTYRTMTDAEYKVKLNAEIHINELTQTSHKQNRPNEPDHKNHKFAKDGFNYRTAYFKDFDGQYYKLTISVGENGNVSTVYNVGKIKKDTLPSGKIVSTFSGSKANNASFGNSISRNKKKVKKKSSHSVESSPKTAKENKLQERLDKKTEENRALKEEIKQLETENVKKERAFRNAKFLADMVTKRDYMAGSMLENEDMKAAIHPLTKIKSVYQLKRNGGEIRRIVRDFGVAFYNTKNDMFAQEGAKADTCLIHKKHRTRKYYLRQRRWRDAWYFCSDVGHLFGSDGGDAADGKAADRRAGGV